MVVREATILNRERRTNTNRRNEMKAILKRALTVTYTSNKEFAKRETSMLEIGHEVDTAGRIDPKKEGWFIFSAADPYREGRTNEWAVENKGILEAAIAGGYASHETFTARAKAIAEIKRLMALSGITVADLD